ncbi:MAG: GNAT family N-acetyltransferase [Fuerstiella sp.]|nr:GNAT family N-acetyltransferase [Fuerstiella sp.]
MKILFLTGWHGKPDGVKPTFLRQHGHQVIEPPLDDDDFATAVRIAQQAFDEHQPDVVVGLSRGGAVAINIDVDQSPRVLMCPGWNRFGNVQITGNRTIILHSRSDDVVPFSFSEQLVKNSGLSPEVLIDVGKDHFLSDPQPLQAMLEACEQLVRETQLTDVTVYYLEMFARPRLDMRPPREGLTVRHVPAPTVTYYRSLYDAVGKEYKWLSRRKLTDHDLAAILDDPQNELYVLHVDGAPAGFAELDCRRPPEVELTQFGLMSGFIGQGLGTWFLQWTIDRVWNRPPARFWLHTCSLDHPAALPTYQKAGFIRYKVEQNCREL